MASGLNYYAIILVLLTTAGLGMTLWGTIGIVRNRHRQAWPQTSAIVVEAHHDDELAPEIVYRYELGDEVFESRAALAPISGPGERHSEQLLARYAEGSTIVVRYATEDPALSEVVDLAQQGDDVMICLIGIATMLFGLYGLLG